MTISCDHTGNDNIARLNAFLDRFESTIDPDFDDAGDDLAWQFGQFQASFEQQ